MGIFEQNGELSWSLRWERALTVKFCPMRKKYLVFFIICVIFSGGLTWRVWKFNHDVDEARIVEVEVIEGFCKQSMRGRGSSLFVEYKDRKYDVDTSYDKCLESQNEDVISLYYIEKTDEMTYYKEERLFALWIGVAMLSFSLYLLLKEILR